MKLICITGDSGSGKTTVAKKIQEFLPHSLLIHADDYMKNWVKHNIAECQRIFNISQETVGFNECRLLCCNTTLEQFRKFIATVTPFVEKDVEKIISLQKNGRYSYAIIEWAGLCNFKIWNRADYRITIKTQESMRIKNLTKKMVASGRYNDNAIKVRTVPDPDNHKISLNPSFIIENNYDDNLYLNIQSVCSSIISQETDA